MGLNAYIQRCSILQLFIDLLVDHGFSREVTRVRFYFLLPTSKNFCGSLPTKTVNLYSAFYALIIVEVIVIVMDVIIQVFQTIVQRAFCTLSSLCRQLYLYRQLSLCIQLCFCRHPWFFLFFFSFFPLFCLLFSSLSLSLLQPPICLLKLFSFLPFVPTKLPCCLQAMLVCLDTLSDPGGDQQAFL